MLIDQSIARCRAYKTFMAWNISRFAKEAGLNEATIRHMDGPDWTPNVGTLRALESIIPIDWVSPIGKTDAA